MKKLIVFLSIFVYLFSALSLANISFQQDAFLFSENNGVCKHIGGYDDEKTINDCNCIHYLTDIGLNSSIEGEIINKSKKYTLIENKNPFNFHKFSFNREKPINKTNKKFSFADMVGIILMLN